MSGPSPRRLRASRRVRAELKWLVRRNHAPYAVVQRGRIVLLAIEGFGTEEIARRVGTTARTVRKWKSRFLQSPVVATLNDAHRSGRPAKVPVSVRCQLIQLACDRPNGLTAPFREIWTYGALGSALGERTGHFLSISEIGRILRFENLRPHRVKQWLKSSDPSFEQKASMICDLYLSPPSNAVILCVDEKPMQVLERASPTHVDRGDASVRFEFEYKRHGTQCLLAAFNIATGFVHGTVVARRSANALVQFIDELAEAYPTGDIYIVWDNLNTHYDGADGRWTSLNARHSERFHFIYTPKHASWMNQVEIWFSILQRRVLRYGSFASARSQRSRVDGFKDHWNRHERHPFRWTWRSDARKNRRRAA